jgi:MraZ protein
MFLGSQQLTIDAKNRLSVPYIFRRKFDEERDGHSFYALPGRRPRTLSLYPDKRYERVLGVEPDNEVLSDNAYGYRQFLDSHTVLLDPDKQGRVLIPEWLLSSVGIENEVVLAAVRDHLELWRRDDHEAFAKEMWAALPERRASAVDEMKRLVAGASAATTATADAAAG